MHGAHPAFTIVDHELKKYLGFCLILGFFFSSSVFDLLTENTQVRVHAVPSVLSLQPHESRIRMTRDTRMGSRCC